MSKKQLRCALRKHNATGIWQLRYKPIGADKWTQKSLKTTSRQEAEKKRDEFVMNYIHDEDDQIAVLKAKIARLEAEKHHAHAVTHLALDNVWTAFMESVDYDPISATTLTGYKSYWFGLHGLKPWMEKRGISTLADFSHEDANDFIKYLAKSKVGRQTTTKYLTFFRRLWDVVAPRIESPWKRKKARGTGGKVPKKPFTLEHQRSILQGIDAYFDSIPRKGAHWLSDEDKATAKIEYHALHIILAYTGLRLVDACLLNVEEVFFDRGVIELAPQKTRHRSDDPMYAKIGIHPTLAFILRTLLHGRSSGYFLPYIASEYEREKSAVSKRIQKQIKAATGLECSVKPQGRARAVAVYGAHSHRKALSDRMREAGVDVMVRLQVLGHKDSRSEQQDYSYISDAEAKTAIKKSMPDLLVRDKVRSA